MAFFAHAACVQMAIDQGDVVANLARCKEMVVAERFPAGTLVVLPELWATGFDYPRMAALARETPGILQELYQLAKEWDIWLAGSLPEENGAAPPFNTLHLIGPQGLAGTYRKHHLFGFWQEDQYFCPGNTPQPIVTSKGPVGAMVCYDLRFPEICCAQVFYGCKCIMISAQWPESRLDHWQLLVRARAVENQAFVIACNGCGRSGNLDLAGYSMIVSPDGVVLAQAGQGSEVISQELVEDDLLAIRSRFCTGSERPWPGNDQQKIMTLERLQQRLYMHKEMGSKIAFTNGCFDILHAGHVSYLEEARRQGDCLVIGLNSDRSVRALKGDNRPVNSEKERARVLAALGCVDYVVIFDDDTPHTLITSLLPDILVKGADWPEDKIVGAAEVKAAGGRVERIVFEHQVSTTGVIQKIRGK